MSRSATGLSLLVVGLVVAAVGIWGSITSGSAGEVVASDTTTTQDSTASTTSTTTATTPTTTPSTSTTLTPSTTTTVATTTTTADPATLVEAFVVEFAAAIEAGDVESLFATLSPDVVDLFGADLCRDFIESEILLLEDYRISGDVTRIEDTGSGPVEQFEAPVTFTFQGSEFDANAMFAIDDGVRWFGECR